MARSALLDMAFGYMPAQILYAAVELRLADALADGPRTAEELAEETRAHAPSLHRLLRALTVLGAVRQVEPNRFALTEEGERLRPDAPGSICGLVALFCGPEVWRTWGDLVETVRTGEYAWERMTGMIPFEYFARNPEASATFNRAMAEDARNVAPALVRTHDFGRYRTIADIGGGNGTLMAAILRAVPGLRGVLFDLPAALEDAGRPLEEAGVADRCEAVSGDFFASVPEGADAYVLKSVIHDWDDEKAAAILRTCRAAMTPEARVLIVEPVLPPLVTPEYRRAIMSDVNMLVATGGRERTEAEFRDLLAAAGLRQVSISDLLEPTTYRIIEAARRP
ncbi:methyltransferase [Actinomadura rubrobrunea]|uniref:Methyltransferase n=1 Tax=Actinomadura rubrobrunea TaxID=115335 RepID=A0A9W6UW89_9ACTN|nr:methyltransferase [Actinomadura rubrobrunea]GLW63425.1 methyltransferase [Actinomadura rubrobrunea]